MDSIIGYVSLATAVIGSAMLAFNVGFNSLAYGVFAVSAVSSIYLLRKSNAQPVLLWTQVYFLCVNMIGFIRYWK